MIYDFDNVPERRPTDSIKWNAYDADVLPLWVADMDFPAPEPVLRALHERVEHGIFGYPAVSNRPGELGELRQVLVERLENLYGWQVGPDELLFLPGVVTGLNLACHALAEPGGGVLVQTPVYPPFLRTADNSGMLRQEMELSRIPDGSYEINWETFEAAISDQTRIFTLCNPHNPVGRVFRRDELEKMAEICLRHGVVICSDEIHCDLLFSGQRHIPIASLDAEVAQQTITLMAPSKTFNIAGLQCSFIVVQNPQLRSKLQAAHKGLVAWVNVLGLTAGLSAYRDGQEWLDQLLVYLESNRELVYDFVAREMRGVSLAKPEGTYLAWLDCRQAGIDGNPYEFFLKQARVALNDGATFGKGGEGFVRLNFACPRHRLVDALERMRQALDPGG
jgi:cystathionine beta-lyase